MAAISPDNYSGPFELFLPTTVGRMLTGRPNKFTAWLREQGILYKKGKSLKAKLRYENLGYLMYETTGDESAAWDQVYFTRRGMNWVTQKYKEAESGNS